MKASTKIARWSEIIVVYAGIPIIYYYDLLKCHKLIPLILVFCFYLYIILRDKSFKRHQFRLNGFKAWNMIFFRTSIVVIFLIIYVGITFPDQFFEIPTQQPKFWLFLIVLYPLWSVIPQEFVYRVYFYHRFKGLFKNRNMLVLLNAILFSFCHIVFQNYVALLFTFVASIMFSLTYLRYRSFSIIALEHAIYGNLIFTIGPGSFFYMPQ